MESVTLLVLSDIFKKVPCIIKKNINNNNIIIMIILLYCDENYDSV